MGITKTLEKLKQRFYWVGYRQSVTKWIACIAAKGQRSRNHGQMKQYNSAANCHGPFPFSNLRNKYVLVVRDYFSKCKRKKSSGCIHQQLGMVFQ